MKQTALIIGLLALPTGLWAAQPAATAAAKQGGPGLAKHDNNAPIDISSDSFQADLNAKSGTYTGNVIITQGDMKLRANTVRISTVNDKADKITASGNVVVVSPSGTATGDNGIYSVVPRTVLMTGHVVLSQKGRNTMTGTQATLNMATGLMAMTSAKSPQNPTGRVQTVITPNSQ